VNGFDQKAVERLARPDVWALDLNLRVDGRAFSTKGREYIIPVMRDTSPELLVRKAAQTAFTISFLVRTFHWITERRWNHLYLLPLKTGSVPFVQKRVDPIIDSNPVLASKFGSVDNRTHKQTNDDVSLLIRGTNVESELQETPTDVIVFDEFDRMVVDFPRRCEASHRRI
jgi:phage terminase large subunit GpA-like protein